MIDEDVEPYSESLGGNEEGTICWLLAKVYEGAKDEETRINVRKCITMAKKMHNKLQEYKDVVYVASSPQEFADSIEKALEEDNTGRINARRKKVERSSWDSKAKLVLRELFNGEDDAKRLYQG